jgi:hypothetical protein
VKDSSRYSAALPVLRQTGTEENSAGLKCGVEEDIALFKVVAAFLICFAGFHKIFGFLKLYL